MSRGWRSFDANGTPKKVSAGAAGALVGEVTLGTSTTTTTISDAGITTSSRPMLHPKTLSAAGATLVVYSTVAAGVVTIHHNSSAITDRTFHYAIL